MAKIYKDSYGWLLKAVFDESLAGATGLTFEVLKPDGSTDSWTASLGSDNESMEYVVASGDLDQVGDYRINPKFTLGTFTGMADTVMFTVLEQGN